MLRNIRCTVTELVMRDSVWHKLDKSTQKWTSLPIENMLQAKSYYKDKMQIRVKTTRKFGDVVSRVVITCGSSRSIYDFDYSNAEII